MRPSRGSVVQTESKPRGRDRSARMDKLKAGHCSAVRIGRSLAPPGLATGSAPCRRSAHSRQPPAVPRRRDDRGNGHGSADTSDALTAAEDENELERQGRVLPLLAGRPELPCSVDPPLRSVAPVGRSARVLPARARAYSGRQRRPCGVPGLGSACETPERCRIAALPYVCAPIAGRSGDRPKRPVRAPRVARANSGFGLQIKRSTKRDRICAPPQASRRQRVSPSVGNATESSARRAPRPTRPPVGRLRVVAE